jgi:hypothetical protein
MYPYCNILIPSLSVIPTFIFPISLSINGLWKFLGEVCGFSVMFIIMAIDICKSFFEIDLQLSRSLCE